MSDRRKYVILMIIWIVTLSVISCTMILASEGARVNLRLDESGILDAELDSKVSPKKGLMVE